MIGLVLTKFDAKNEGGSHGYAYTYAYGQEEELSDDRGLAVPV